MDAYRDDVALVVRARATAQGGVDLVVDFARGVGLVLRSDVDRFDVKISIEANRNVHQRFEEVDFVTAGVQTESCAERKDVLVVVGSFSDEVKVVDLGNLLRVGLEFELHTLLSNVVVAYHVNSPVTLQRNVGKQIRIRARFELRRVAIRDVVLEIKVITSLLAFLVVPRGLDGTLGNVVDQGNVRVNEYERRVRGGQVGVIDSPKISQFRR